MEEIACLDYTAENSREERRQIVDSYQYSHLELSMMSMGTLGALDTPTIELSMLSIVSEVFKRVHDKSVSMLELYL